MIGDFEFVIDDRTPRGEVRKWSELVNQSGCNVEFLAKKPYRILNAQWRHLDFGHVCINFIRNTCPFTAVHLPDLREVRQNRNFKLVYTDSQALLDHYQRRTTIPENAFVLMENAHPFEMEIRNPTSIGISLNLDGSWLRKYIPNPQLSVAQPILADAGWGKVLLEALETIEQQADPVNTLPRSLIVDQLGALLSLIMLPDVEGHLDSRHQVSLYSKLDRILHDNFHQSDLDSNAVARKAGISRRHVFNIFAKAGTTFSSALLKIRLDHARRMFSDERYGAFRVCDVAWACGFTDLSHFGKRFREMYACTPTVYRRASQANRDSAVT